ncbi:MAG: DNA polymerase III subunit gamma/tau, partial [Actinobacteria bacterium]|nr:DNA polymerase III subunit gamma/tau [Actinomycetota bacterium]
IEAQHATGADPAVVLSDLAEFTHYVTRLKLAPQAASHAAVSETERVRGAVFAEALSVRVLSRAWQMLLKGLGEVTEAARPLAASTARPYAARSPRAGRASGAGATTAAQAASTMPGASTCDGRMLSG